LFAATAAAAAGLSVLALLVPCSCAPSLGLQGSVLLAGYAAVVPLLASLSVLALPGFISSLMI
jgi:hypothetical protein